MPPEGQHVRRQGQQAPDDGAAALPWMDGELRPVRLDGAARVRRVQREAHPVQDVGQNVPDAALAGVPGELPPRVPAPQDSPGVDGEERERRPPALREVLPARDPVGGPRGHLGPLGRDVARAHADLRALAHSRQRARAGAPVAPVVVAQHHGDLAALRALPAGQLQHVARDVQGSAPKRPAPYPGGMGEPERPAVGGQRQAVLRLQIEGGPGRATGPVRSWSPGACAEGGRASTASPRCTSPRRTVA